MHEALSPEIPFVRVTCRVIVPTDAYAYYLILRKSSYGSLQ